MSADTFTAALARARRRRQPVIALRPRREFLEELDDIVVRDVECFRMEAMSRNEWWLACTFANGERLALWIGKSKRGDGPARLVVTATEIPDHLDWDELHRKHSRVTVERRP